MKNWQHIVTDSYAHAASEVLLSLKTGDNKEAEEGLSEMLLHFQMDEKKALISQLTRLMAHIIKWKVQPQKISKSWYESIMDARIQIEVICEDTPSLNRDYISLIWERAFVRAINWVKKDTGLEKVSVSGLMWEEVFENNYFKEKFDY